MNDAEKISPSRIAKMYTQQMYTQLHAQLKDYGRSSASFFWTAVVYADQVRRGDCDVDV